MRHLVGAVLRTALFAVVALLPVPAFAQGRSLRATRELSVSGTFSVIADMAVTPSGVIAIAEDKVHTLSFFDAEGKALGKMGRRGGGPGEFAAISGMGARGETFWIADPLASRISWVKPDGALIKTRTAPAATVLRRAKLPYIRPTPSGIGAGDTLIVLADREPSAGVSPFLGAMGFGGRAAIRLAPDGAPARMLAQIEASPSCAVVAANAVARVPLCAGSLISVRPEGDGVVVVAFDGATLSPVRVRSIGTTGETLFTYEMAVRPAAIPRAIADSVLRPLRDDARYRAQVVAPRYYPPVRRVIAGADGSVWLEVHQASLAHEWLGIAPNGRPVGRVTVPAAVRLMQATVGKLWGVELDADDVPTIVRYRVE
jgi:hypothetical protein